MQDTVPRSRTTGRAWRVEGQVQGVGFRPFVYRLATELGLAGSVRNGASGVTIDAWGPAARLEEFARRVRDDAPALARVDRLERCADPAGSGPERFRIVESDHGAARVGRVTVDSATCPDCVREMLDPADRRHRHALVNCTNCGPRYTIIRGMPYDRPATTMARFPLCPACAAEYADPGDRRFHAQPVCCPACGPRVVLLDAAGASEGDDPLRGAAARLRAGRVIAMKGLGGYHLVVDATNEHAVRRLRERKQRDHKPFAVMVRDADAAGALVRLSPAARDLLVSPVAPIVLAPRAAGSSAIADAVAPGVHRLGVMVPATPMQHLLFAEGLGPLVMTSANRSDDPLISDDDEARALLGPIADDLLTHDRAIERAVDDSVVLDAPTGLVPLRRARGFVPTPLRLPVAAPGPGLCTGGELKGAVAVVREDEAILGEHLGDLTFALAHRRFVRSLDDLRTLFDVAPRWIACDAHPAYTATAHARRLAAREGLEVIPVQHHHAHLAAVLAEHGRSDRAIGLVCDGVGYGADGTAWGGEVLVGDLLGCARVGRMRPLRLPGGDAAARETGRCGLSWLTDLLGPDARAHPVARTVLPDPRRRAAIAGMLARDLHCPPSSGLGRLFDAAASVLGVCDRNHYEAMSGCRLEALASAADPAPDPEGLVPIDDDGPIAGIFELDHRPLLRRLLAGRAAGEETATLALLVHAALADGLDRAAARAADRTGLRTVALSGGVFCNTLLAELLAARLAARGLEVLLHRAVPPNDGGLALGQAAIAAAVTAARGGSR